MSAHESPQPSETVQEQLQRLSRRSQALDPKNWVYVFSSDIAEDQVITGHESLYEDGKRHVFLNPTHKSEIDWFLASVSADTD